MAVLMTRYPVDYEYTKNGVFLLGYAETEDEALALINDGLDDGEEIKAALLIETEAGVLYGLKVSAALDWEDEIDAGYAEIRHVYGGYRCVIMTWKPQL